VSFALHARFCIMGHLGKEPTELKDLIIVESPTKARTIGQYLGKNYIVLSSQGHVRDLPSKDGAVDPDNDFAMTYELNEGSEKHVRAIIKAARKADQIIAEGVRLYMEDMRGLAAVDVVKDYRRMAEQMREMELQRALRALARGEDPQRIVTQLARGITNKLIHAPTTGLRQASADGRQDLLAHARKLLGLAAGHRPQPEDADSDDEKDFDLPAGDAEKPGHTLQ